MPLRPLSHSRTITVNEHVQKVRENGGQFRFKLRLINKQGDIVPVESIGVARPNGKGEVSRVVGVFRALGDVPEHPGTTAPEAAAAK